MPLWAFWGGLGGAFPKLPTDPLCITSLPLTMLCSVYPLVCLLVRPAEGRGALPYSPLSLLYSVRGVMLILLAQKNQGDRELETPGVYLLYSGPLIFFFLFVLYHCVEYLSNT